MGSSCVWWQLMVLFERSHCRLQVQTRIKVKLDVMRKFALIGIDAQSSGWCFTNSSNVKFNRRDVAALVDHVLRNRSECHMEGVESQYGAGGCLIHQRKNVRRTCCDTAAKTCQTTRRGANKVGGSTLPISASDNISYVTFMGITITNRRKYTACVLDVSS